MSLRSLAVLASAIVLGACHGKPGPSAPPPTVQVVEVTREDVPIYHQWVGTLDGLINAEIKPQVTGYVRSQIYPDGAFVRRGEVLFLIDPRNYKDAADAARAELDRSEAALGKARLDVQRDRQLIAAQAITRQQFDNDLAAEQQAIASAGSARASWRQAQLNHSWTQVSSLIDGIAGIAQVQVGNLVSTSTSMTSVSQVDPIKVQFSISETEYLASVNGNRWAEPGRGTESPLELILQDGTVHPHRGKVIAVNRQFSAQTGTIVVQAAFPNPGNVLRPGQYARVRAAIATHKDALLVPQRAISELQGKYLVGVVGADGKFDLRPVKTSAQVGSMALVDQGLNAGDRAVVSFIARLKPGMAVHAVPASDKGTASAAPADAALGRP
jgi:membrane fusion protein (multidrug efflux system)